MVSYTQASTVPDRVSRFLDGSERSRHAITTPEGVALSVEIAQFSSRCIAFVIDWVIQILVSTVITIIALLLVFAHVPFTVGFAISQLIGFFVSNGYFIYFEMAWLGATPGKRALGLRVIDRRGGPISPMAAVTRNLTREIEIFLPLGLLLGPHDGAGGWERLALGLWMALFAALPLFNRNRMRAGDFIAGTMVIMLRKKRLLADITEEAFHYTFADRQLRVYGAFELQVLEELLRRPPSPDTTRLRRDVCRKICARLAWPEAIRDANIDLFLTDFYTAQRAFLEREQLFGRQHLDKFDKTGRS